MTELSGREILTAYLFTVERAGRREWYGATGYSLADAVGLLHSYGYDVDPERPGVTVREDTALTPFEERHLGPNMGPMQLRGVWYPRHNLGDEARNAGRNRDRVT